MITIFNPDKLTRQPFFQDLIHYLNQHDDVTLRHIKQAFSHVKGIDKALEAYIQAGYICRKNRRYHLCLPLLDDLQQVTLEDLIFVDRASDLYEALMALVFETVLSNQTNQVLIKEKTTIERDKLTLANYFYRLRRGEALSDEQLRLYALLGDVNQDYALKYMTSFLLKFARKEVVMQKRTDIFVNALELLGYIEKVEATKYCLKLAFDKDQLIFYAD
ncbi:TPA: DUF1803 domain-containing protein [Streptococcus equi subsp. zooepidemicus]|nr:DUF1803 domain-containing protein [Streptococcus equi subsp. zooepidemicus]HEL0634525.1 DUF1803 domain-containing protein [Streptococcus equi subsp. zooepidemicus]HEL1089259.1 DUF1803 domain-containing protein [Streptococcus equi subsp. zooepidemicus]